VGKDGRARVLDFGLARDVAAGEREVAASDDPLPNKSAPNAGSEAAAKPGPGAGVGQDSGVAADVHRAIDDKQPLSLPLTQAGALMGTPRYMAPEQFRGQPTDARTDQFSFCVALHEALHDSPPFAGNSLGERCYNVIQGNIQPPPPGKHVPSWLQRALLRGLSVAPGDRFPSMDELLQVLSPEARQARQRWLSAGLALLIAVLCGGAVAAAVRWNKTRLAARCNDSAARLDSVWGPTIKEQAHQALLRTGKAWAVPGWERTDKNLTEYLQQWATARAASCQAAFVNKTENPRLHDRRMRCLDSRLQEVSAFVSLVMKVDADMAERVAETSSAFTPVSSCADTAALMSMVTERPEVRDGVDKLNRELAEVRVISKLAHYDQARSRAQAALERARQLGYPPATASAYQQLATIENDNADFAGAERDYFAMAIQGLEGGDRKAAAIAFLELMRIAGRHRKQFEYADRYAQLADAELVRASTTAEWIGEFKIRRSWYQCQLESSRQQFVKAEKECRSALALCEKLYKPGSLHHIGILISLANSLKRQDKLAEALTLYQESLRLGEQAFGETHPNVAVDLYNLGNVLFAEQRYAEATEYYLKALAIYRKVFGEKHPKQFNTLAQLTRASYRQKNFEAAMAYARQTQNISSDSGTASVVAASDCLIGDVLYRQGRFAEALEQHQKALDRCDRRSCELQLPYYMITVADDLRGLRKAKHAVTLLEQAQRLQAPTADREVVARNQFSLARALVEADKRHGWARGEQLATSALVIYQAVGRATKPEQAEVEAWLAAGGNSAASAESSEAPERQTSRQADPVDPS